MTTPRGRNAGKLFDNADKRKPSQPDMTGTCSLEGATYDVRGWHRDNQLALAVAPTRGDSNTYPPEAFRGALEAVSARGRADDAPVFRGEIVGDDGSYQVNAFEKQGKSGRYLTLSFERGE